MFQVLSDVSSVSARPFRRHWTAGLRKCLISTGGVVGITAGVHRPAVMSAGATPAGIPAGRSAFAKILAMGPSSLTSLTKLQEFISSFRPKPKAKPETKAEAEPEPETEAEGRKWADLVLALPEDRSWSISPKLPEVPRRKKTRPGLTLDEIRLVILELRRFEEYAELEVWATLEHLQAASIESSDLPRWKRDELALIIGGLMIDFLEDFQDAGIHEAMKFEVTWEQLFTVANDKECKVVRGTRDGILGKKKIIVITADPDPDQDQDPWLNPIKEGLTEGMMDLGQEEDLDENWMLDEDF